MLLAVNETVSLAPYLLGGAALITSIWTVVKGRSESADAKARRQIDVTQIAVSGQQGLITSLQEEVERLTTNYDRLEERWIECEDRHTKAQKELASLKRIVERRSKPR